MGVGNRRARFLDSVCRVTTSETSAVPNVSDRRAEQRIIPRIQRRCAPEMIVGRAALGVTLAFLIASGAAILALAAQVVRHITQPTRRHQPIQVFTPWEFGVPFEPVRIPAAISVLDAWYLAWGSGTTAPVIMVLAGHGGTKSDRLGVATYLVREGFNCLLFDYHGCGTSPGSELTLGYRESMDALAALDWVTRRAPGAAVGVLGYSMGGSVAVRLAARDERVRAVMIDSAFATQRRIVSHHVQRTIRARPGAVVETADRMLQRRHGFRLDDFDPLSEVAHIAPRPILIVHPTNDRIVPFTHGLELWRHAGEPKQFWVARGASHCGTYFQDREGYCRRTVAFFRRSLAMPDPGA
jgi:uncharacterized protein